jgi:hypothetical protein
MVPASVAGTREKSPGPRRIGGFCLPLERGHMGFLKFPKTCRYLGGVGCSWELGLIGNVKNPEICDHLDRVGRWDGSSLSPPPPVPTERNLTMLRTMIISLVVIIAAIFILGSKMNKTHTNKVDRVSAVEQMMNN